MPPILRSVLAVGAGVVAGGLTVFGIEVLGRLAVPPPPGHDPGDPASIAAAMAAMPPAAFAILLLAYVTGPTLGAWLAARRAPSRPTLHAASVGAFFVAGGLSNFLTIPHPVWFVIAAMVVLVAAPFVGARLARR